MDAATVNFVQYQLISLKSKTHDKKNKHDQGLNYESYNALFSGNQNMSYLISKSL